jgi:hypothetical protein
VFRLEGNEYVEVAKAQPVFKERSDFLLVHDPARDRLIAWGGEIKGRKANDTLFFDGKTWTAAKRASPLPKDFKPTDVPFVDFNAIYDSALERVVRFGWDEVAVLDGDSWKPNTPKQYKKLLGPRARNHFPAHDAATGETLLVDLETARVVRFDLDECKEVAPFVYPDAGKTDDENETAGERFATELAYDPTTRTVQAQHESDKWARHALDLSEAFEAARRLGPRKKLEAPAKIKAAPVHLYRFAKGKVTHWEGGTDGVAAQRKKGFVTASELVPAALEALGTRRSSAMSVSKKRPPRHATSRLGGLPSGISLAKWPKLDGKPMGFLFQLVTGDHLPKHAALAVFCALDGTATDGDERNVVVLLRAADLATPPLKRAPEGVPVLAERAIDVEEPRPEIDDEAVGALASRDPEIGARFDDFQANRKVQEPSLGSKLGGAPWFLQGGEVSGPARFIAQLDVDSLNLKEWPDAGLAGCVYVHASPNEKGASAFWQYT